MDGAVTVRDVMTREYIGVSESDTVSDAVDLLLREDASSIVVIRGTTPVGVVSERDLLSFTVSGKEPETTNVAAVMNAAETKIAPDQGIAEAAGMLSTNDVEPVLVMEGSELVGLLTERDVLSAVSTLLSEEEVAPPNRSTRVVSEDVDEFSTQSVCEICGSLTPDLQNFNGQMVCSDCRSM